MDTDVDPTTSRLFYPYILGKTIITTERSVEWNDEVGITS